MDELRQEFEQTPHAELVDYALDQADQIDKLEASIGQLMAMIRQNCPPVVVAVAEDILKSNGVDHE